jgi:O-acetyl-ADP-ribose deacetylase (regulator of RNase III)
VRRLENSAVRIVTPANKIVEFRGPGDITNETTLAIVNAANSSLLGGGGVDGAIHRHGGPAILEECKQYVAANGRLPPGQAMITGGGRLTAKYVIHTVGPVYRDGKNNEPELLASCHRECVCIAEGHRLSSMAFPAISTGAYGYPLHEAAAVAVESVLTALEQTTHVDRVHFVLFDVSAFMAYLRAAEKAVRQRTGYRLEQAPFASEESIA